ncbi:hypothetical protein SAMN04489723_103246 [Algoriphagus aquimarinus]|uniref:Uncharacterized protein n=1 Tax=Algoriphagus aquimarinus TaxID=237018 RepID=A0A1I0XKN1_9BACT|nr:hypothetical protein SAMN04489723_103246 [Algoriphagus aquimarinus]
MEGFVGGDREMVKPTSLLGTKQSRFRIYQFFVIGSDAGTKQSW